MTSPKLRIASIATFSANTDVKSLIPNAAARRRMSRLIKMGVAAGLECLAKGGGLTPDAVETATGLGFLADTEKLLAQMATDGESMMAPTPFMQSTFNTIGSQLAIMTGCKGQNMTFSHMYGSFGAALIDSAMLAESGEAHNILVVAADELTATLDKTLTRMGLRRRGIEPSEGAVAMLLTTDIATPALGTIEDVETTNTTTPTEPQDYRYPTAAAERMAQMALNKVGGIFEAMGVRCKLSF